MKFIARNVLVAIMLVVSIVGISHAANMGIGADGKCYAFCDVAGIKSLRTSNGYTTNLFSAAHTTPALVVEYNGRRCYADLVNNAGTGINITTSNGTYHTHAPDDCYEPTFWFTPATTDKSYGFEISAAGTYTINWGDGKTETINKTDTATTMYTHTYPGPASNYKIGLGGKATAYNMSMPYGNTGDISFFNSASHIKSMDGCLGCIFSTLPNGNQPLFSGLFARNTELTGSIPKNLFDGINGAPRTGMFYNTFVDCENLTGNIPETLFAGLKGAPASSMFNNTFRNCKKLTGNIPDKLFSGISGAPAQYMFYLTFMGCGELTGQIPATLFSGISGTPATGMFGYTFAECGKLTGDIPSTLFAKVKGAPAKQMFINTFYNCGGLTAIEDDLFAGISTQGAYQEQMFFNTFAGCTNLRGSSAKIDGKYLYQIWPDSEATRTYSSCTNLSDYDDIPQYWK